LSINFGLGCAATWGAADFAGGLASRKGNLLAVIFASQFLGGLLLAVLGLIFSESIPPLSYLLYGGLAGIFGDIGLIALYKGLAQGRMGIVAPLSAVLTALVPIGYSAFYTGLPSITQLVGFTCFMVAIWLLSAGDAGVKMTLNELFLSIIAGFGFGFFFILIDRANDLAIFWPLVSARLFSVLFLFFVLLIAKKFVRPVAGQWVLIGIIGALDALGNAFFSIATHLGRLDVSAVLGALYPAATVILAWFFLRERLGRKQWIGVVSAFVALILISI
ncbi:MAG: DMT family transporter, partial [Desulfobacterales bacterium]|nr:DMT family transporter [Desulfobacterales bacterium]